MAQVSRSALIGYSAQQMFDLVNDIEQYPQFMQGCRSARILSLSDTELVGELSLAKAGITQTFVTRNMLCGNFVAVIEDGQNSTPHKYLAMSVHLYTSYLFKNDQKWC